HQTLERQLKTLLAEQRSHTNDAQKKLASLTDEQQRVAERLQELEPKDAEFWRIEEAAELVTQAEQRLVLTADGEATLRLLKRADALLSKELHSRSEEHTSELQSRFDLVCRLLLEKKKKNKNRTASKTNKVA